MTTMYKKAEAFQCDLGSFNTYILLWDKMVVWEVLTCAIFSLNDGKFDLVSLTYCR